jgi:hypothetical protein
MTGKVNDYINDALAGSNMPDSLKRVVANLATNAIDGAAGSAIDQMSGGGSSGAQAALGVDRYNRQLHWDKFLAEKAACDKAPSAKGCETIEKMGGDRSQFIGDMGMSQSNVIANYDADGTVVSYTVVDKDNNQPLFIMEPLEFAAYLNASDASRGWYLMAPQWSMDSASSMLNAAAGDFGRAQEDLELAASSPEYWWTVALSATGSQVAAARGAGNVTSRVVTPYGDALQSTSIKALAARGEVQNGATLYRVGTTGKSQATEAQFWALEHPSTPGFAERYGIPPENVKNFNFIEAATLKSGTTFVTRRAPGVGTNAGGGIEVVVPQGGVQMKWFSTQ